MSNKINFFPLGDNSILIQLDNKICEEINKKVQLIMHFIENSNISGVVEVVNAYSSLQIIYNPMEIDYDILKSQIVHALKSFNTKQDIKTSEIITIPVVYGEEFGPDIDFVAKHNNITIEKVINIHSSVEYRIYMIGFMPGFPYLGGMSEGISTPRLESPRQKIEEGSVGIAGNQTGIYSIDSPGGWRIIGRTPIKLFDPSKEKPVFLKVGQFLRFKPILKKEYFEMLESFKDT